MHLTPQVSVSALTVFLQGLLSFFSPCVLPILPLYLGYLSGASQQATDDFELYDEPQPKKGRLVVNTFFFILGISFAFFLLALGFTAFGQFLQQYSSLIAKIGGVIVILFGLYQLDIFGPSMMLSRERKLAFSPEKFSASPLTAMVMGFTFSFGWTPCVGPALTSALLMASSSESAASGFLLVGLYTLGFTLPFLAASFFAEKLLGLFAGNGRLMTTAQKLGGVLMIIMGVLMFIGFFLPDTTAVPPADVPSAEQSDTSAPSDTEPEENPEQTNPNERTKVLVPDVALVDREGNSVSLRDFAGQTVFLNFWATWCGPCVSEMPDIQQLYEDYGMNEEDVAVIGIAAPDYYQEGSKDEINAFLDQTYCTYPVLYDETGAAMATFGISAYPTTYMIDDEGYFYGYIAGAISYDTMVDIIQQTQTKDYSIGK